MNAYPRVAQPGPEPWHIRIIRFALYALALTLYALPLCSGPGVVVTAAAQQEMAEFPGTFRFAPAVVDLAADRNGSLVTVPCLRVAPELLPGRSELSAALRLARAVAGRFGQFESGREFALRLLPASEPRVDAAQAGACPPFAFPIPGGPAGF